jgi:hypothetical protein
MGCGTFDFKKKIFRIDSFFNCIQEEHQPVCMRETESIEKGERAFQVQRLIHDLRRCGSQISSMRQQIEEDLIEEWLFVASLNNVDGSKNEFFKSPKLLYRFHSQRMKRKSKSRVKRNNRMLR